MLINLQPATIDLISQRMKRDGYASADVLVREALASLKHRSDELSRGGAGAPSLDPSGQEWGMDLSYDPVPLQETRSIDVGLVKSGDLEMVPFE